MKLTPDSKPEKTAAAWLVEFDSKAVDAAADEKFVAWMEHPEHEAELQRCEAALQLTAKLKSDPELRRAFDEVAALAKPHVSPGIRGWLFARPVRWGIAALAITAAATLFVLRETPQPPAANPAGSAAAALVGTVILDVATSAPVVVLPGRVVVDARSVAVLPFALLRGDASDGSLVAQVDAGIAAEFHREVIAALASISGVYVIPRESVLPYSALELLPSEIAVQLGARGIAEGSIRLEDGRIRVAARLTDTATNALLWQNTYESPADDLLLIEADVAGSIAVALVEAPPSAESLLIAAGR